MVDRRQHESGAWSVALGDELRRSLQPFVTHSVEDGFSTRVLDPSKTSEPPGNWSEPGIIGRRKALANC